ncbi:SDR family oxidoreductase [Geodermatophilus aquaeductus]|uniref:3-oxoacyl-[acyl-carrier protein] reductase n=1 Tax=Geodermatophilus aquaeductus TaxID=1564161 RepID=A0A521AE69_9ACTN|nr:SDR family oxidoreductase [Geodermatophilus aquaeductus]SMO33081.1 3-oxoacyl-[acyl-carrier protein] reductase [Geodermatophilus aquaeductus]
MSEQRSVMVTGASKGIGLATAERFARRDDVGQVVVVARDSPAFDQAVARLEAVASPSVKVWPHRVDLADRAATLALVDDVYAMHGNVDVLVNNAGYTRPEPIHQIDFAEFERTMAVNLYAPFTVVQGLLHAGNRFEVVVNVASTAGMNGRSGWLTYSASKAAVINMSEVMREELAIYGTRVACVSPGRCATDLRRALAPDEDPATIMQPGDVAAAIEMLASDVGRFVDSANLVVRQ